MFFFLLIFIFSWSVISCSGTSEVYLVQTDVISDEQLNAPPLHLTLILTKKYEKEVILKAKLTRTVIDSSNILIHSLKGAKTFEKPLIQCFYEIVPQYASASELQQWDFNSGSLSLCENGIRGHLRASWSNRYPTGAVYYIEPVNLATSERVKAPSWSPEQLRGPHRLTIVPITANKRTAFSASGGSSQRSDQSDLTTTTANSTTITNRSTTPTDGNHRLPVPSNSTWSDEERVAVHGLRDSIQATIDETVRRRHPRRVSSISEEYSSGYPHLEPVRVFHRPNQPQPHILELYLVVDEVLTSAFRGNYDRLIYRVNMLMALVNSLYAPFNINIVVVQLEIWEHDRSHLNVEEHHLLATLAQFKRMHTTVRHDCLHALLGIKDEASRTRGKANPQTMCVYSRCVGYSRDSPRIGLTETARTIAHELGHNFGLRHDTEECKCQGCIMATGVEFGNNIMEWSPCSIEDLPILIEFGMGVCLADAPARSIVSISSMLPPNDTFGNPRRLAGDGHANPIGPATSVVQVYSWMKQLTPLAVYQAFSSSRKPRRGYDSNALAEIRSAGLCGNGQLDPGEECDCGSSTSCPEELRDCCDVSRCRLKDGSECAGGPCCSVEPVPQVLRSHGGRYRCRLLSAGTVCRNESGSCDLPEYCDGKSQWCPADVYKADGVPCRTEDGSGAYCIRGGCRNADGWCRTLWGNTARRGATECFYENHLWNLGDRPDPVANCGKHRPPQTDRWEDAKSWPGIACQSWHDAECGRLWCDHRNEKAMLLGWIDTRTHVLRSGDICAALVYDPVWPASDRTTWATNVTFGRQHSLNSAGVGIYAANTQDAGMVPDGTPCSRGLCYNGTCTSVHDLPSTIQCDCNSQGVCNNLGHCHCKPGFHPPHCEYGGDGGSVDSGPPPPDLSPNPMLVIALCLVFFVALPLTVFLVYWSVYHRCSCRHLLSAPTIVPTKSGLQKPFDRGLVACIRRCCRCRIGHRSLNGPGYVPGAAMTGSYPILAYAQDDTTKPLINGSRANGHCVTVVSKPPLNGPDTGKSSSKDTVVVIGNGVAPHHPPAPSPPTSVSAASKSNRGRSRKAAKSDRTVLISEPTNSDQAQINGNVQFALPNTGDRSENPNAIGSNRMAKMWENALARNKRTNSASTTQPNNLDTTNDSDPRELLTLRPTNDSTASQTAGAVQISQPQLKAMTYQGEMCSLNEAISTLKRGEKPPKMENLPKTPNSTLQRTARSTMRSAPQQSPLPQDYHASTPAIQPTVNRSHSQRVGLSPRDISNPKLQNTTYTEALTDLETVRQQRNQMSRAPTLTGMSDRQKSTSRRLL